MTLSRTLLSAVLAMGLLLGAGAAAAADSVQRSTDEKGTIIIKTPGKGEKGKAGDQKTENQAAEVKPPAAGTAPAEPPPPGLLPSHARRARFGPDGTVVPRPRNPLLSPARPTPAPPRPEAPAPAAPGPAQPAPPAPESQ